MQLVDGKVRIMREELKDESGRPKDTDEIRESYNLGTFVSNVTYQPANETQNPHFHYCIFESIHVLSGYVEVYTGEEWRPVHERQAAVFHLGERHNVRTKDVISPVNYSGATERIAAVHIAYKWVPPHLDVDQSDTQLLLSKDWGRADYNPGDPKPEQEPAPNNPYSPIL